jgi:hypothetical protein
MRLAEAVKLYKGENGAYSNAYDWYRRGAMRDGAISIAGVHIAAWKQRGVWVVAKEDLERGLRAHRRAIELRQQRMAAYERHELRAAPGEVVELDWPTSKSRRAFTACRPNTNTRRRGQGSGTALRVGESQRRSMSARSVTHARIGGAAVATAPCLGSTAQCAADRSMSHDATPCCQRWERPDGSEPESGEYFVPN